MGNVAILMVVVTVMLSVMGSVVVFVVFVVVPNLKLFKVNLKGQFLKSKV